MRSLSAAAFRFDKPPVIDFNVDFEDFAARRTRVQRDFKRVPRRPCHAARRLRLSSTDAPRVE